jgi:hypothetical protein
MEDLFVISFSCIFGVLFIGFSKHKKSFEKTAKVQGVETAEKNFEL